MRSNAPQLRRFLVDGGRLLDTKRLFACERLLDHLRYFVYITTVNSLLATTSRKRPPPVSDHFVNNRFVSQSNTVLKTHS